VPVSSLYLADRLDPAGIMARVPTTDGSTRIADPWQRDALRSRSKRQALLAARQTGKGEVLTVAGLSCAASRPDQQIGILTPSLRQSCRLLRRIRRALPAVPYVEATNRAVESLTLSNGSEIVAWPGNRPDLIRGDSLALLLVDEAAWVEEEAFLAALPMLGMTDGTAILASTPGGPSGLLFDLFNPEQADDPAKAEGWDLTRITADDCPRYTEATKAELRRALGEVGYSVEMLCEWREGAESLFTREELADLFGISAEDDEGLPEDDAPRLTLPNLSDLVGALRAEDKRVGIA